MSDLEDFLRDLGIGLLFIALSPFILTALLVVGVAVLGSLIRKSWVEQIRGERCE